jgi:hypothetical protein
MTDEADVDGKTGAKMDYRQMGDDGKRWTETERDWHQLTETALQMRTEMDRHGHLVNRPEITKLARD